MKSEALRQVIGCVGFVLILAQTYGRPLGLSSTEQITCLLVGVGFVAMAFWPRKKKDAAASPVAPPQPFPLARRRRVFWSVAVAMILGGLSTLIFLPYTVENFFPSLYFFVIPALIVFLSVFLVFYWKKLRCSESE